MRREEGGMGAGGGWVRREGVSDTIVGTQLDSQSSLGLGTSHLRRHK